MIRIHWDLLGSHWDWLGITGMHWDPLEIDQDPLRSCWDLLGSHWDWSGSTGVGWNLLGIGQDPLGWAKIHWGLVGVHWDHSGIGWDSPAGPGSPGLSLGSIGIITGMIPRCPPQETPGGPEPPDHHPPRRALPAGLTPEPLPWEREKPGKNGKNGEKNRPRACPGHPRTTGKKNTRGKKTTGKKKHGKTRPDRPGKGEKKPP